MTGEREQAARGLGGRAALEAYRAARVAQRGDLRAALRANREALRAARVAPGAAKVPEDEAVAVAEAPAPPVMAVAPAPRSVFASLVEAERGLAPPEPVVAEEAPALEEPTAVAEEAPPADAAACETPIVEPPPEEPPAAEPIMVEAAAAEAAMETVPDAVEVIEVTAEAPPSIDLMVEPAIEIAVEAPRAVTDLSAIRELGPGMRHRLAQIGYHSCEDLAAADPARLSQQLGEVSRLLRPESWIAAARAATA
ncbi:hypothetical protein G3576_06080 [Roseomonas stagni]|uniref:Uncharacterized protein n=1 Tax=Falsiroseomonas algicola TaxID=2716930 RepID=A0A6M1LGZ7_9PROT|nr:hypothetical protein [Falsiroseomonas algicola]NGM19573.1 hypothetical protein [Falsiroseomonas algicola]